MSTRSDSSVYVDLCGPTGPDGDARAEYRKPRAWDTDHDAWQGGCLTDLPHGILPILAEETDANDLRLLFAVKGPHFNNFSIYVKRLKRAGGAATPLGPPPIFKLAIRTGIPCLCDQWVTATIQATDYDQGGLVVSGVIPFAQALEVYGGIVNDGLQPVNSVIPVELKLRIVVAYSANDLGLATFESTPASITNGLVSTLGP